MECLFTITPPALASFWGFLSTPMKPASKGLHSLTSELNFAFALCGLRRSSMDAPWTERVVSGDERCESRYHGKMGLLDRSVEQS